MSHIYVLERRPLRIPLRIPLCVPLYAPLRIPLRAPLCALLCAPLCVTGANAAYDAADDPFMLVTKFAGENNMSFYQALQTPEIKRLRLRLKTGHSVYSAVRFYTEDLTRI